MMKWLLKVSFSGALICASLTCGPITYKLQIVQGPIGALAEDRVSYTSLSFFAHNDQSDFLGYEISTGLTRDESLAFGNPVLCPFVANSTIGTKPTMVQIGGTQLSGFECFNSSIGPLTPGTWISVRSKRDCTGYVDATNCNNLVYSDASSTEVLAFVDPPDAIVIQFETDPVTLNSYYLLKVSVTSVPAGFKGIGLFYSSPLSPTVGNAEEAKYKASRNGNIHDGFCNLTSSDITPGVDVVIQIGGTRVSGTDCYFNNIYISTGDTIAVRNSVDRLDYPWSDFKSATVP